VYTACSRASSTWLVRIEGSAPAQDHPLLVRAGLGQRSIEHPIGKLWISSPM
jgi:hypothetical protein